MNRGVWRVYSETMYLRLYIVSDTYEMRFLLQAVKQVYFSNS